MLRAATQRSFKECLLSFVKPVSKLPHALLLSIPARLVFGVYLGTYATANSIDTITNVVRKSPATQVNASSSKFVGTAVVSTALTVYKDSRMAQCLGAPSLRGATPLATYCLFTARDAITIFASFNLPTLLAPNLARLPPTVKARLGRVLEAESGRFKTAQFLASSSSPARHNPYTSARSGLVQSERPSWRCIEIYSNREKTPHWQSQRGWFGSYQRWHGWRHQCEHSKEVDEKLETR